MIIGVPVFACIYDIFGKLIRYCLKKRGEDEVITNYEKEFLTEDDQKDASNGKQIANKVKKMFVREEQHISEEETFGGKSADEGVCEIPQGITSDQKVKPLKEKNRKGKK